MIRVGASRLVRILCALALTFPAAVGVATVNAPVAQAAECYDSFRTTQAGMWTDRYTYVYVSTRWRPIWYCDGSTRRYITRTNVDSVYAEVHLTAGHPASRCLGWARHWKNMSPGSGQSWADNSARCSTQMRFGTWWFPRSTVYADSKNTITFYCEACNPNLASPGMRVYHYYQAPSWSSGSIAVQDYIDYETGWH